MSESKLSEAIRAGARLVPPCKGAYFVTDPLEALHAARVELLYSQFWGEASPRIEQVVEMVERAVAA